MAHVTVEISTNTTTDIAQQLFFVMYSIIIKFNIAA